MSLLSTVSAWAGLPAVNRGWSTLARVLKSGSGVPSGGMIPPLGSSPTASGLLISQSSAMSIAACYACVTIRAEDFARCTPSLFKLNDDGTRVEVTDHPVAKLLKRPNRAQSWFEFAEQMQGGLMLRSNAYAAIRRDKRGNPIELIPINPDAVMVLETVNGSYFYLVNRIGLWQIAMLSDWGPSIPAEDMLHIRGICFNTLVAPSRISLARDSLGVAMGLEQQAARWMNNGARPSGVLQSKKPISETAGKRLRAQWDNMIQGVQNTGGTAILEDGVEWKQLSLDAGTLEFISQRNYQIEDIARFWRMPPHKIGRLERSAAAGLAQQDQDYVSNTIMPDLHRWESRLSFTFDLDDEGLFVDFDEGVLLRADITTRYTAYRTGILSGFLTPNEVRRQERLPADPNGNKLLVPSNTAALGSEASGTSSDGAGKPAPGEVPISVPTGGDQPDSQDVAPQSDHLVQILKIMENSFKSAIGSVSAREPIHIHLPLPVGFEEITAVKHDERGRAVELKKHIAQIQGPKE